jgi:hypothetical protein
VSPYTRHMVRGAAAGNVLGGFALGCWAGYERHWTLWCMGLCCFFVGRWILDGTDTPWWRGEEP